MVFSKPDYLSGCVGYWLLVEEDVPRQIDTSIAVVRLGKTGSAGGEVLRGGCLLCSWSQFWGYLNVYDNSCRCASSWLFVEEDVFGQEYPAF